MCVARGLLCAHARGGARGRVDRAPPFRRGVGCARHGKRWGKLGQINFGPKFCRGVAPCGSYLEPDARGCASRGSCAACVSRVPPAHPPAPFPSPPLATGVGCAPNTPVTHNELLLLLARLRERLEERSERALFVWDSVRGGLPRGASGPRPRWVVLWVVYARGQCGMDEASSIRAKEHV